MAVAAPVSNQIAANPQALDGLRKLASSADSREGIKAAAGQFEAYFLQMMLRSMRETLTQDGPFDSQETKTFGEMFDQQMAQTVSQGRGVGLADMLVAQIERQLPQNADKPAPAKPVNYDLAPVEVKLKEKASAQPAGAPGQEGFAGKIWPKAVDAAKSLGVQPHFLVAQAALETGWGKSELKTADGRNSHNLFNIKAGAGWKGATVDKEVTEVINGKSVKTVEKFRAYASYEESLSDYAALMTGNPRYSGVLNQDAAGFSRGLQQGGFATDPAYRDKLMRVIHSQALRSQLASVEAS